MSRLVIFGTSEIAEIAHLYFTKDSPYEVAAFAVDAAFRKEDQFCGLPLVDFETVESLYPPDEYKMFVAVSYRGMNVLRREKFDAAQAKGYDLVSYVSSRASNIGDAKIGKNCFIFEDNTIQPFVKIGDNVTLWSGNHIGHHSTIGDNCFIASHVVISGGVDIGNNCFIGVNATLRDHIKIAPFTLIGAGALILHDTEEQGVYTSAAATKLAMPSTRLRSI